jgi:hypothetical protein
MKRALIIILAAIIAAFALSSCQVKGDPGKDAEPIEGGWPEDSTTDTPFVKVSSAGKIQKGPCPEGGDVRLQPIDITNMRQSGEGPFFGNTLDDFGRYYVPMNLTREPGEVVYTENTFEGPCHNELTAAYDYQKFSAIVNVDDEVNNINPLTDVRSFVARWLFGDPDLVIFYGEPASGTEGDIAASLTLAESKIIEFLQMPDPGKKFTEMNLENADIGDAILALFNSAVLQINSGEIGDYLTRFSIAVIEENQTVKDELQQTFIDLPLMDIKRNLENRWLELGQTIPSPPIWRLGAPDYYADLLERTPVVQTTFNLEDETQCSFDQSTFNLYAVPVVFKPGIKTSRFIALNFPPDIQLSVWALGTHMAGYPIPGYKVADITPLKEIILETPEKMSYNGMIEEGHSLQAGVTYYYRIRKDNDFVLSKGCGGTRLYTEYTLASEDEGETWIGHNNNANSFFNWDGVKGFTVN